MKKFIKFFLFLGLFFSCASAQILGENRQKSDENLSNLSENSEIFKYEHSNKTLILLIIGELDKCEARLKAKFDFKSIYKMPNSNVLVVAFTSSQSDKNLAKIMQNFLKFDCVARVNLDYIKHLSTTQKEAK
ncbi:MAG: hypothetical protein K5978_02400 [Campylobacter sp.]|nr:hypothetical protein [Campylobacter sp.]